MINISNNEHWLVEQSTSQKDNFAIYSDEHQVSYSELLELVKKTVSFFIEKGIKSNDHIALLSENNLEFILTVNALWFIGAVPIPLNIRLSENELREMVEFSDCNFIIITDGEFRLSLNSELTSIDISLEIVKSYLAHKLIDSYNPSNTCLMMFTSGSTGFPKCVELTFDNIYNSAKSIDSEINHYTDDIWLASLPFYHIGGFSIIARTIIAGCKILLPKSLKSEDLNSIIIEYKPSLISLVPQMFKSLIKYIDEPWAELKQIFLGGGPIPNQIIEITKEKNWPISIVYGSTETASMVSICSTSNLITNGISAGVPLAGVRIKIDEAPNLQYISIKSRSVAKTYYKVDGELANKLLGGKFRSKDLGEIDEKGNLHILGRGDEVIISGGENISLIQIRKIIADKFIGLDFVNIGIKDEKWGQSYVTIVESDEPYIEDEVEKYLRRLLPKFKMPKRIYLLKSIPRNEIGKIKKKEIQKLLKIDFL